MEDDSQNTKKLVAELDKIFAGGIRRARLDLHMNYNQVLDKVEGGRVQLSFLKDQNGADLLADAVENNPNLFTIADLYKKNGHVVSIIKAEDWAVDTKLRDSIQALEDILAPVYIQQHPTLQ